MFLYKSLTIGLKKEIFQELMKKIQAYFVIFIKKKNFFFQISSVFLVASNKKKYERRNKNIPSVIIRIFLYRLNCYL